MIEETLSSTTLTPQEQRARLLKLLAKKDSETKLAPLSFSQERFWIQEQLAPGSINSLSFSARIRGDLKVDILQQSLVEIVRRHDSLRTSFALINGQPMQSIKATLPVQLPIISLEHFPAAEREAAARQAARLELSRAFDIVQGPLFRATLLRLSTQDHVLILITQHLISDAWSLSILLQEVGILYEAFSNGQASPLPPLAWQYTDFAQWQRETMQGELLERELAYWIKQVGNSTSALAIPTDRPRTLTAKTVAARQPTTLPLVLREQLKALAHQEGCTLFMVLLAGLQVLLHRYTGQDAINVHTMVANRTTAEIERLIGLFLNTLLMRADLSQNPTFSEFLQQVRQITLDAYDHQTIPFQKLIEALQTQRDFKQAPLFQVLLLLQNVPYPTIKFSNLSCERFVREMDFQADMELAISLVETDEGLSGWMEYQTELYDASTIQRMLSHYQTLLASAAANPQQRINHLPLLTKAERHQLIVDWNDTDTDFPRDCCLHEWFETQVKLTPTATAVVAGQQRLSYNELNRRANQVAHYLQARGVGPNVLVGLCVNRSLEMMIGLWGILKAGGAYVPLDPAYPPERLAFMLEDAQVKVLLTQQHMRDRLPAPSATIICLDSDWAVIEHESEENPHSTVTPHDLLYVIYTSGSTGRPKGAGVYQRGFVNLLNWYVRAFQLTAADRTLVISSFSFDLTQKNFYAPLMVGGELHLFTAEQYDPAQILSIVAEEHITWLNCTPSAFYPLVEQSETAEFKPLASLRYVFLGGEPISMPRLWPWLSAPSCQAEIVNTYGPTECTDICASCRLTEPARFLERAIPIGRPIDNTRVLILNPDLEPVPIGVAGELHVAGVGVGLGYLNDLELTLTKFIPDPFSREPGARLYKTGDLARYRPDGHIEFLGRLDHQVKIRGFRIEPGEIEAALRQHPTVREAAVVVRNLDGSASRATEENLGLVAYVVPRGDGTLSASELRAFLRERVPHYMIPSAFVSLAALPLTASGKVDRQALPAPEQAALVEDYAPPETALEEKLIEIWSTVLPVRRIGIHDNFFEIGGHSLLAAQIIHRINHAFQLTLPLRSVFDEPTVAGLGLLIEERLLEEVSSQLPSE